MFETKGRTIRLSAGDTGLIGFEVEGVQVGENDLAVFTVRKQNGELMMEKVLPPEDNVYMLPFLNSETEQWREGEYMWDLRIALDAQTDAQGHVTDGREVITPFSPGVLRIVKVVGRI